MGPTRTPTKRKAGTQTSTSGKKARDDADSLCGTMETESMQVMSTDWADKIVQYYDEVIKVPATPVATFLSRTYDTLEKRRAFAEAIDTNFPGDPDVMHLKNYTPGAKFVRPWQVCWDELAGNRGLVLLENQRNLLILMIAKGFMSNADVHVGAEKVAFGPPIASLVGERSPVVIRRSLSPAFEAFCTKGWTRCTTLLFLCHSTIHLGLVETMAQHDPTIFKSYGTIHGFIPDAKDEIQRMDLNRGSLGTKNYLFVFGIVMLRAVMLRVVMLC